MAKQVEHVEKLPTLPPEVEEYLNSKLSANGKGGRPHFLKEISKQKDPKNALLEILERKWLRNKSTGSIARKYDTIYNNIYRILQDLAPFQDAIVAYLRRAPRTKVFYNKDTDSSDYDSVQDYINRAHRMEVKRYKERLYMAKRAWKALNRKDPARWTAEDVQSFLATQPRGSRSAFLDGIRMVAPQIKDPNSRDYVPTGMYRMLLNLRKKPLFSEQVIMMVTALEEAELAFHALVMKLHITVGAREGQRDLESGITGIGWDRFSDRFTKVDDYEAKTKGGIWWRGCPVNLFWDDLSEDLRKLWLERGKPVTEKLILGGYQELLKIYKEIRNAFKFYFGKLLDKGEIEPKLFKEITTLRPHDSDKIHCNLLWEADVKIEVVCGEYLGGNEGVGLVGRGWLNDNTVRRHYLSLTQGTAKFKRMMGRVAVYSQRFALGKIPETTHPNLEKMTKDQLIEFVLNVLATRG